MAFVLLNSQFEEGLQRQSQLLLSSIRWIADVNPFSIALVRVALETDQIQAFTDSEFDAFLREVYSLDIDTSLLTNLERTVLNEIREFLDPPPNLVCCGSDAPTALNTEHLFFPKENSLTFEFEAQMVCDPEVTCDVKSVELTISAQAAGPPPTSSTFTLNTIGCVNGKQIFSKLWLDFTGAPTGETYDISYDFLDSESGVIATIADTIIY